MSARTVRADLMVGCVVRGPDGKPVGRLREMCAEVEGGKGKARYVVREFQLSPGGALESFLGVDLADAIFCLLGRERKRRVVRWQDLDLTDPAAPRLRAPAEPAKR